MHNEFYEAFNSIHATEQLKQGALHFLRAKMAGSQRNRPAPLRYAVACCAMLAIVLCGIGGYHFHAAPVSYISVDVNPSIELQLNRVDRVVAVASYNKDGADVLRNLNLKNKPYVDAIELLLADEGFARFLSKDAMLSFTVVSDKEEELLIGIRQCHGYAQAGAQYHSADAQLVEDAHHNGLSFGKYQAFVELSRYDSSITAEDCRSISMRQIRELIDEYESGGTASENGAQSGGHHRCGHGGGAGRGRNAQ